MPTESTDAGLIRNTSPCAVRCQCDSNAVLHTCPSAARGELITLTQYLRPNATLLPVDKWVEPAEFEALEEEATAIGYSGVLSGPLVRSSHRAGRLYRTAMDARKKTSTTEK